jgi:hypothetical protein
MNKQSISVPDMQQRLGSGSSGRAGDLHNAATLKEQQSGKTITSALAVH